MIIFCFKCTLCLRTICVYVTVGFYLYRSYSTSSHTITAFKTSPRNLRKFVFLFFGASFSVLNLLLPSVICVVFRLWLSFLFGPWKIVAWESREEKEWMRVKKKKNKNANALWCMWESPRDPLLRCGRGRSLQFLRWEGFFNFFFFLSFSFSKFDFFFL